MVQIKDLKFDKDGLIPAIVVDAFSKKVLTLAYMSEESLKITLEKKKTCFWSRSRQELWLKGETSGNFQQVLSITADCDKDALVVVVQKDGPACHLGTDSCFEYPLYIDDGKEQFSIEGLYELLQTRKNEKPQGSYTTYLFEKGVDKICKKITTSVIEPDKMRAVLKMSYDIEWEDFLEKYFLICK